MRGPKITIENVSEHNDKNNALLADWDGVHNSTTPTMGKGNKGCRQKCACELGRVGVELARDRETH